MIELEFIEFIYWTFYARYNNEKPARGEENGENKRSNLTMK